MSDLSVGKVRGLQQISTEKGIFVMSAIDHRGSFKTMIEKEQDIKVKYKEIVGYKKELCAVLASCSSAVLLDPIYGAAQCIAGGALSGHTGLLVSIEATGYQDDPGGRVTMLLEDWGVGKIKRMGASAVKLLVYYRPDLGEIAGKQLEIVKLVAEECIKYDLPFLVEPVSYAVGEGKKDSSQFAARKPELVIETAKQMTALPVDVLKAEFPADLNYEKDDGKLLAMCQDLDKASQVPWVLLSAGVDYEMFRKQVRIASRAGASGFLAGRAIWQEALQFKDKKERSNFLNTTVVDRLKELADIASSNAVPWYRKLGIKSNELAEVAENWYETY